MIRIPKAAGKTSHRGNRAPQTPLWERYLEDETFRDRVDIALQASDPVGTSIGMTAWRGRSKLQQNALPPASLSRGGVLHSLTSWGTEQLDRFRAIRQAILDMVQNESIPCSEGACAPGPS